MKQLYLLLFVFSALLSPCTAPAENIKTPKKMEQQKPSNPYYSRTDTAKLNLPDAVWKKVLSPEVYAVARKKRDRVCIFRQVLGLYRQGDLLLCSMW